MTNFEYISKLGQKDLISFFIDLINNYDNPPWSKWFTKNYCNKCEVIKGTFNFGGKTRESEFCFCELEKHCKFFPEAENHYSSEDWLINKWLTEEKE